MRRKKCTTAGCGCFEYVSDLTNRRICTCGHAAANHESDEWHASAVRAAGGHVSAGSVDAGTGRIYAAIDLRTATDWRDLFYAARPALGAAPRTIDLGAPEK